VALGSDMQLFSVLCRPALLRRTSGSMGENLTWPSKLADGCHPIPGQQNDNRLPLLGTSALWKAWSNAPARQTSGTVPVTILDGSCGVKVVSVLPTRVFGGVCPVILPLLSSSLPFAATRELLTCLEPS
jgi:hypothetical protein